MSDPTDEYKQYLKKEKSNPLSLEHAYRLEIITLAMQMPIVSQESFETGIEMIQTKLNSYREQVRGVKVASELGILDENATSEPKFPTRGYSDLF